MLLESIEGVEEIIVRTPGLLARLSTPPVPNYELAKEHKIAWGHFDIDANDDGLVDRPFFILQESDLAYRIENSENLEGISAVDVYYTEVAHNPTDNKASRRHFMEFVSSMIDSINERQSQPIDGLDLTTYITIHQIQLLQPALRTKRPQRDPSRSASDYWSIAWRMHIGGGPGGLG